MIPLYELEICRDHTGVCIYFRASGRLLALATDPDGDVAAALRQLRNERSKRRGTR